MSQSAHTHQSTQTSQKASYLHKLNNDNSNLAQRGFTMIEMLVVMSLVVMLMITATGVFMTSLIGNTKTNISQSIKEEGEFALSQIEFLLRNAVSLEENSLGETCSMGMDEIRFTSIDNGQTTLFLEEDPSDNRDKIASNSGVYITSGGVDIITGPTFDCTQTSDLGRTHIKISFTMRKGDPGVDEERDIIQETFSTGVNLRSF